jgi:uncharacterized protein YuzE
MKVYYDKDTDSAYIELSSENPEGVVEVSEGVNLDTTHNSRIVGIEILEASKKLSLSSLFNYEVDRELLAVRSDP